MHMFVVHQLGSIILVEHRHVFLKCLCQARKLCGHVFRVKGYPFCLFLYVIGSTVILCLSDDTRCTRLYHVYTVNNVICVAQSSVVSFAIFCRPFYSF